ncbi:MAG: M20/M25/M40 family metallo-hydrolase [Anaerolineae bacterium]|jgi:putative selenium metabolism hydrolase
MIDITTLNRIVGENRENLVAFAQKLVQTPSPSGAEGDVAALVRDEMERLAYDRAWIDEAGNVIGLLAGGDGPSLMFNGHLDHVDAGDPARWPHPPFGGQIHDGALWGRGSVDMKGALAAMVYAVGLVKALGRTPPGDLYVSGVVQEEVGGLGARHLAATLPLDRAVVGEASSNQLRLGHRGRVELRAVFEGRSVHASMPDLGINPHHSLARFLDGLSSLPMASHPDYGPSTVAPTRIESEPQSTNVTPATLRLTLDWRNVPGEEADQIVAKLESLLKDSLQGGCRGHVEVGHRDLQTYTGLRMSYPDAFGSFSTPAGDAWLLDAHAALAAALERQVQLGTWRFATDGAHFAAAGATVLGLGPGDDTVVHTVQERLPLDQLVESVAAYLALALLP